MVEMLIHTQWSITQAGPSTPHRMIRARTAHILKFLSLVKLGETFTTALIETKGPPLIAGSIITGE